jgi:hypothetical protein
VRSILIIILFPLASLAQENSRQSISIKDQWLVHTSGSFLPFKHQSTTAIFFWVDGRSEKGSLLYIAGRHPYSLLINAKLVVQKEGKAVFSIDSLARIYSSALFIELFSANGAQHLQTDLIRNEVAASQGYLPRAGNYFLDFTLLASLIIIIGFIAFLRTNPTLTLDYVDINKLFSFQDRDESTLTLRIASSVNLLIYLFSSMFLGLVVLITLHFLGDQVSVARLFPIGSTIEGFKQWSILSTIIFGLLMIKLFWLVVLSALFGFRDMVRIQFFNFVRIIFIAMFLLSIISLFYFVLQIRSQDYFFYMMLILSIILVVGAIANYFKLMARMRFHFFHLFSYLCASEIIPLMILIKVLLY